MRRERRSPAPEEEEEGEEDLEKKRMVSESEAGDEDVLEFGHTTNCYSLFVQGAVGYFYANRHRLRGVLLASTLVAALLIIAVLFISIYDPDAATTERTTEDIFISTISTGVIREHLHALTKEPHVAGTTADYENAKYVRDRLEAYGIQDVHVETVPVLTNMPVQRVVEIVYPDNLRFQASLTEPAVPEDPLTQNPNVVPTFNGFSANGNVTADLVYVNYGREEDYALLAQQNISVSGMIAIARYGQGFRGNKAKLAEEKGAVGLLLYSDPHDDGFALGMVYPDGPWRPAESAQRGSVWEGQGDPLTPGWPSTPDGPRLDKAQAYNEDDPKMKGYSTLPKIPVQPLSWADALPLLAGLQGQIPSESWRGALNVSYAAGPGPVRVHLELEFDYSTKDIWNVVGSIRGHEEPDRLVIIGNHRDAWVYGAGDPHSGTSTMLEIARALAICVEGGWKPRRTIMFASWDGEEYGLLGSVEFVEKHAHILNAQAVAYINVDFGVKGTTKLQAKGTPNLQSLLASVVEKVSMPDGRQVREVWEDGKVGPLGATSDFMPFLQEIGIASMDLRFIDAKPLIGVYHSIYDTPFWIEHFVDPTFEFHATLGRLLGVVLMRLSGEAILPFDYNPYASLLQETIKHVQAIAPEQLAQPLAVLGKAGTQFQTQAGEVMKYIQDHRGELSRDVLGLRIVNDKLMRAERGFIEARGTLGRALLRHIVFAPALADSASGELMPTITHSVRSSDWAEAQFQILRTAQIIDSVREILRGQPSFN